LNKSAFFLIAALVLASAPATAGESPFGYIYTTDTHPRGTLELEQWATFRRGKLHGDYLLGQYRTELEYGVTDRFQASLYWNAYSVNANANDANGETSGPYVPEDIDRSSRYRRGLTHDGWSAEFIHRLLSPYTDAIGLALYLEPTVGKFKKELEGKIILQKNLLDDLVVIGYNLTVAPEWEKKAGEVENITELEHMLGVSYRFAPRWSAALELRNHNEYSSHSLNGRHQEHSAWFLGPTLHYASNSWWVTATWLPQMPWARCYGEDQCAETSGGRIYGDEHERNEFRIKLGLLF
jgi:hypothetical protein